MKPIRNVTKHGTIRYVSYGFLLVFFVPNDVRIIESRKCFCHVDIFQSIHIIYNLHITKKRHN